LLFTAICGLPELDGKNRHRGTWERTRNRRESRRDERRVLGLLMRRRAALRTLVFTKRTWRLGRCS
jgi:hypothetical protein